MKTKIEIETEVLSTLDGERGTILNGVSAANGEWVAYEVITQYGVEVWNCSDFVVMSDCV